MSILPPPPPRIFCKYADNYCVTSQKLVLDISKAARMPPVPNCSKFFVRKTCRWTAYTDVRCPTRLRVIFVRALYLPRLFAKRPITFGKQHNFFTTNQLSHKTRKKIFRMFFYIGTSFRIGTRQSKKYRIPQKRTGRPPRIVVRVCIANSKLKKVQDVPFSAGFLGAAAPKPHFSFFGVIGVLLSFVGKKKKAPLIGGIFKGDTP